MAWSVSDLTSITHLLTSNLRDAVKAWQTANNHVFDFEVSGLMPAVSRTDGNNVMSLYLLHVSRDPYWRNTPVQGSQAQLSKSQPLALDLSYLLTTYSEKSWHIEQWLMSVALSYFHANPIYTSSAAELTITVEADTIEEMSRLWQAITVPIRLSAMFRVAVVFLSPEQPPVADSRLPVEVNVSVGADLNAPPPPLSLLPEPQLFEIALQVSYRVSPAAINATDPSQVTALPQPPQPTAVAGQTVRARGSGLQQADAGTVYFSVAGGGGEWPLPANWRVLGTSASGTAGDADELVLELPSTYAGLPASGTALSATPLPGNFLLTVGNAGTAFRSNALPLTIAPEVTGIGPGSPILAPATDTYTFSAGGLVDGETSVLLETTALTIGATVAAGVAVVNAAAGSVSFQLPQPSPFTSGTYVRVRLIVNNVEAPPGWWVQIP